MFQKSVKQENDVYDLNLLKYMRAEQRGIPRPDGRRTAGADAL